MPGFNVAFWNVQNLFEPAVALRLQRGPRTVAERDAKLAQLAAIIGQFFNGQGPDLLALAEVATRKLFDDLVDQIPGVRSPALRLWEPCRAAKHTGLGLVGRDSVVASLGRVDAWRPTLAARPRALSADCTLAAANVPVRVVVSHWKSRLPDPPGYLGPTHFQDRKETADWVGRHLNLVGGMRCAIVLGDLNCQPDEEPLNSLQLYGTRQTSAAIYGRTATSTLYNTAWRLMVEPDPWEYPRPPGYQASRPKSTFGTGGNQVFDHLLVSRDALYGRPLALREGSVHYHPDTRAYRYTRDGHIRPRLWRAAGAGFTGASDHLPLLASFDV